MRKIDVKDLADKAHIEFKIKSDELLRLQNEIKLKQDTEKKLEEWLNVVRGRYDAYMEVWNGLPDPPPVVISTIESIDVQPSEAQEEVTKEG
jgi:hypothetical protein